MGGNIERCGVAAQILMASPSLMRTMSQPGESAATSRRGSVPNPQRPEHARRIPAPPSVHDAYKCPMGGAAGRRPGYTRPRRCGGPMLIHVNCLGRTTSAEVGPTLAAVSEAVEESGIDPDHLVVSLDWVQYKRNFREPIVLRRFVPSDEDGPHAELVIDMRRALTLDLPAALRAAIIGTDAVPDPAGDANGTPLAVGGGEQPDGEADAERVYLEDYRQPVDSVIWKFNKSYWEHLSSWEATFKKDYVAALPGGASDGTNPDFWRDRM